MEEREVLRRAYYVDHKSVRQIAWDYQVARRTVRKALASAAAATYRLQKPRPSPKLGPYQARIADLLAEDARVPRKQRNTSHEIFELLQDQGYIGSEARVATLPNSGGARGGPPCTCRWSLTPARIPKGMGARLRPSWRVSSRRCGSL